MTYIQLKACAVSYRTQIELCGRQYFQYPTRRRALMEKRRWYERHLARIVDRVKSIESELFMERA